MNRLNHLRKFYNLVSLRKERDRFLICLEGKPVKTPALNPLELPSEKVANLVRLEFEMQKDYITLPTMPMYNISSCFQDVASEPALMARTRNRLLSFVKGDTLQFLDPQTSLRERQIELFGPIHALLNMKYGMRYSFEEQLIARDSSSNVKKMEDILDCMAPMELLTLESASNLLKSAGLGLLFCSGDLAVDKAYRLSRMEEDFQSSRFGRIEEFHGVAEAEALMKLRALKVYHDCLCNSE